MAEGPLFQRLQEPGGERDADAKRDPGHEAAPPAPARRLAGAPSPLHDMA